MYIQQTHTFTMIPLVTITKIIKHPPSYRLVVNRWQTMWNRGVAHAQYSFETDIVDFTYIHCEKRGI